MFSSPPTSQTRCMPRCTWELTTAAILWPAQTRTRSCYRVEMRSHSWTRWHRLCVTKSQTRPLSCLSNKSKHELAKIAKKKVWTLYKMYKNEGLLLYVIAVLYFVLLRFLWSQTTFSMRDFSFRLSLTPHLESHYLCASGNGKNWKGKKEKKRCGHRTDLNF